ncbi:MAG TPA: hypothetical protein VJ742_11420 [Nitrososphaera sp.]|nr:hypothetical protein [Nitrososphaera sp.]
MADELVGNKVERILMKHAILFVNIVIAVLVGWLVFLSFTSKVQEDRKAAEQNYALERCNLVNASFTDAVIIDETPFCIGMVDGTTYAIPLGLVLEASQE